MDEYREQVVTTTTEEIPHTRTKTVVTPTTATTERMEQVVADPYAERRYVLYRIEQAIWLVFGIIDGLILIRFILRLLGANPAAGFAQFIYGVTALLIAPFVGLFPSPRFEGSVFEVTSIVAMIVYALLAWLIIVVLNLLFAETRTGVVTRRTDTRIQ